jgi:hypothetical protein
LADLVAFGPCFWLGCIGLITMNIKSRLRDEKQVYFTVWLVVQMIFFFWAYRFFRSERVRYIQSLYFIPMGYGTVLLLGETASAFGKRFIEAAGVILLSALMIPTLINGTVRSIYENTDYLAYQYFIFPTRNMMDAYRFLDGNTPKESTVIASYEAANNIIMYSHSYVIGNKQGWPYEAGMTMEREKDEFFGGKWDRETVKQYLITHKIRYVYQGYQEADGFLKDPFYEGIYRNPEVIIYEVKSGQVSIDGIRM